MNVELRPLGVKCNIGCLYCYQNTHRDAGRGNNSYDMQKMKAAILQSGGPFHLFGGEPLLMRKEDIEELWQWGYEQFGSNGLQTNGVLLDEDHIRMIRQYRVRVGLSFDGPGPLNDARWAGSIERTRKATEKTEKALERLCEEELIPSVLIQLSKCNATQERISRLVDWIKSLDDMGVSSVRVHVLEIESSAVRKHLSLSMSENIDAFQRLADLEDNLTNLRFDLFKEMENHLRMRDANSSCVWRACDPYTTESVHGIGGHGEKHNCGLTDKEGINFQKPELQSFERNIALYYTPQEYGGCKDCRFFLGCKGQCPGTGIDGDWRNRSENCELWKALYSRAEERLINKGLVPLSLDQSRQSIEMEMVNAWKSGENPTIEHCVEKALGSEI